jgi:hypothetical protein
MLGVVVAVVVGLLIRMWMEKRPESVPEAWMRPLGEHMPLATCAGWITSWLRPYRGHEGDVSSLVKARRFAEARTATDADDLVGRRALAFAARGPAVELVRATMDPTPRRARRRARNILHQEHPWLGISRPSFMLRRGDRVDLYVKLLRSHARHGRLVRASRGFSRMAARFPFADDAPGWRLAAAHSFALRGDATRAKALAAAVANSDASPYLVNRASVLSRALSTALEGDGAGRRVGRRSPARAMRPLAAAVRIGGRGWPLHPSEARDLLEGSRVSADIIAMTKEAVRAALRARLHVYAGIVAADGRLVPLPIVSLREGIDVVQLGDGECWLWHELLDRSYWGDRMIVVRRAGRELVGEIHPAPAETHGPHAEWSPSAASALAERHPDDEHVRFMHAWTLVGQADGAVAADQAAHVLAMCMLRFPRASWPSLMLASLELPRGAGGHVLALHAALVAPDSSLEWQALHGLDIEDRGLSVARPVRHDPSLDATRLFRHGVRAAQRGDAGDLDACLRVIPDDEQHRQMRGHLVRLRLLMSHDPGAAISRLPLAWDQHDHASTVAALAAQSGVSTVVGRTSATLAPPRASGAEQRALAVLGALHAGDSEAVTRHALEHLRADGATHVAMGALRDNALYLGEGGESRAMLARVSETSSHHREAALWLSESLLGTALETEALELARAAAGGKDAPGAVRIGWLGLELGTRDRFGASSAPDLDAQLEAALDAVARAGDTSDLAPFAEVAVLRFRDPDAAWPAALALDADARPFAVFALTAAIAERRGDLTIAAEMRARCANPLLIRHGFPEARVLGLGREISGALSRVDLTSIGFIARAHYGAAGTVIPTPPPPAPDDPPTADAALDRLAREGRWDVLRACVSARRSPQALLELHDGARTRAYELLLRAVAQDTAPLTSALKESRHPLYVVAARAAVAHGVDLDGAFLDPSFRATGAMPADAVEQPS